MGTEEHDVNALTSVCIEALHKCHDTPLSFRQAVCVATLVILYLVLIFCLPQARRWRSMCMNSCFEIVCPVRGVSLY